MKYNQPYGVSDPNGAYTNGNPATGTMGSIPPAESIEYPQRELVNLMLACGVTPSNSDLSQLGKSIQTGKIIYGVDVGTANAMAATINPVPIGYVAGLRVLVLKGASANTGPLTFNLNAMGPKNVVQSNGAAVGNGGAVGSSLLLLGYDGTKFQLLAGGAGGGAGADSYLDLTVFITDVTTTYTVPNRVFNIFAEGWAGGGGGAAGNGAGGPGGGGGGGEYGNGYYAVLPGQVLNLVVGVGGQGNNAPGNTGFDGGSTSLSIQGGSVLFTCIGGGAGQLTNQQGSLPGQGGSGGDEMIDGSGGFTPAPFWGGSPGGGTARGRLYAMQGNSGLPPGGGASGNQADNVFTPTQIKGANGRIKLTHMRVT